MKENLKKIRVNASKSYDVFIGKNILRDTGEIISSVLPKSKIALITDDIVDGLYSSVVMYSLEKAGYSVVKFTFANGEQSKNLSVYGEILSFLASNEFTRSDAVVALGGGVVGDMAGFAAATFLRGINYVQIPTTLLAQIDSSVGGKTAVDLPSGKNLVGAFCQPSVVICDVGVIEKLPFDTYLCGMGEMAKYAVLDKRVYDQINKEMDMKKLVYLCVDYKRMIVEEDEFEGGKRRLLNLGHTPAHGIEKLSDYSIPHGRAVALGLEIILSASLKRGYIDKNTYAELLATAQKCAKARTGATQFSLKDIVSACLTDKKRSGEYITLIMVYGVGDCRPVKIKISELKEYLS